MKKILLTTALLVLVIGTALSQQTITITTGPQWQDATIHSDTRPGYENTAGNNYGNSPRMSATAWTYSGSPAYWRSLLYFNLNSIPSGSTIQSATLYFYSDPTVTSTSSNIGNSQLSGSNAFFLEKITGEWHPTTVTWINQPATTTSGRIWVGPSTSATENRQINITSMVQGWVNSPVSNQGIKMILENELQSRSRNYASTNHSNSNIHPKLVISYTAPAQTDYMSCSTPDLTEEEYVNLPWYGSETFLENFYDSLYQAKTGTQPVILSHTSDIINPWLRVPVKFWIYQEAPNTPGLGNHDLPTERSLQRMMDDLNEGFRNNDIKLQFYLEDISFINDASAVVANNYLEKTDLAIRHQDLDALDIHIVQAGGNNYMPIYNAIFLNRRVGENIEEATTMTHEVGHLFGLLHTHTSNGLPCFREPVTRGNHVTFCPTGFGNSRRCRFTGDLLCDTEADPDMSEEGAYNDANCSWDPLGLRDYRNELFRPDARNYMAYRNQVPTDSDGDGNNDAVCRNNFSTGQRNWIYFFAFVRQYKHTWLPTNNNRFDRFEPDDAGIAAREIPLNELQTRTFHVQGRRDEVDWVSFEVPATGSFGNYLLEVTEVDTDAVGDVFVYLNNNTFDINGNPTTRIAGVTAAVTGNKTIYTIPCSALIRGRQYLIEIRRGSAGTDTYNVELKQSISGSQHNILGPSLICSTNLTYTYSVSGLSSDAPVNWTIPGGLTYISGQGTNSLVVRPTSISNSSVNLSATISVNCADVTKTFSIHIGGPGPLTSKHQLYVQGFSGVNPVTLAAGQAYRFQMVPVAGATSYTWVLPTGFGYLSSSNGHNSTVNDIVTSSSPGTYVLYCYPTNNCGGSSTNQKSLTITIPGSGGGGPTPGCPNPPCIVPQPLRVFPNPVDTELTVEIDKNTLKLKEEGVDEVLEIRLFNSNGDLVYSKKNVSNKITIPVKHLPNGLYYIHLVYAGGIVSEQLFIQH